MEVQAVIYLVRHAQTDFNREQRLQGHIDTHIDDYGRMQAAQCGSYLRKLADGLPFDGLFGSDLARCRETAEIIMEKLNSDHSLDRAPRKVYKELNSGLRERDLGPLDGMEVNDAQMLCVSMGVDYSSFGESESEAGQRMRRQFLRILSIIQKRKLRRVLIVTHSSVITRLVKWLEMRKKLLIPKEFDLKFGAVHNTGICQMWMVKDGPLVLQSYGDTSHLSRTSLNFAQGYNIDAYLPQSDA